MKTEREVVAAKHEVARAEPAKAAGSAAVQTPQRNVLRRALGLVLLLALWEVGVRTGVLNPFYSSSPFAVGQVILSLFSDPEFWGHLQATFTAALTGLAGGLILGVALGFAASLSPLTADLLEPVMILLNAVPRVILAPLFVIWLGIGLLMYFVYGYTHSKLRRN